MVKQRNEIDENTVDNFCDRSSFGKKKQQAKADMLLSSFVGYLLTMQTLLIQPRIFKRHCQAKKVYVLRLYEK